MALKNKHVAILVHNYFEESELEKPIEALEAGKATVTVVAADKKDLQAMRSSNPSSKYRADVLLEDAAADDYDALLLPGGVINSDRLRMVEKAKNWVIDFFDKGKLIAAICHAPWLLVSADLVEGHRLTSYFTLQDDIRNAGGEWVDLPVVIDENLITSRASGDLTEFNNALVTWLSQ